MMCEMHILKQLLVFFCFFFCFQSKIRRSKDINLYTHHLHVDGIGSSALKLLTAWKNLSLTRPEVNLFPPKLDRGLNGHRLIVSAFEQPPYVIRRFVY